MAKLGKAYGKPMKAYPWLGPGLYYIDSERGQLKGTKFCVRYGSPYAYGVLDSGYDAHSGGKREIQRTMMELLYQLDGFNSRASATMSLAVTPTAWNVLTWSLRKDIRGGIALPLATLKLVDLESLLPKFTLQKGLPNCINNIRSIRFIILSMFSLPKHLKADNTLGSPFWSVNLGRRDSKSMSFNVANGNAIPPRISFLNDHVRTFQAVGVTANDMVALAAAYTIGQASGTSFRPHVYNDAYLHSGGSTDQLVEEYKRNPIKFNVDFAAAMIKMGDISPFTDDDCEIRHNCRVPNYLEDVVCSLLCFEVLDYQF
uniref:Peroxidase n=1 Tax=Tanacetum cinerariifolium TaxID=118510 RepID=A0A6L2LXN8_TANCI|nr:hypothetical protein [Tanacetum cinerariifolium]